MGTGTLKSSLKKGLIGLANYMEKKQCPPSVKLSKNMALDGTYSFEILTLRSLIKEPVLLFNF